MNTIFKNNNKENSNYTKKLKNNILIDYIYCFTRNIDISGSIWMLYLAFRGMSLWQIGIVEGIFHITSFICEIPTGAIADLLGRKRTIIIGRLMNCISSIMILFGNSFLDFALAFIVSAWSYNLNSGSEEALVYDSNKIIGEEDNYIKINGRVNVIIEIAQSLGTFIGGILAEASFSYCYIVGVAVCIVSFLVSLFFTEPDNEYRSNKNDDKPSLAKHFKLCFNILKTNKNIRSILLYYPVVFCFYTTLFFYGQQYFSDMGLNKIYISLVMLAAGAFSCIGSLLSSRIINVFKSNTVYFVSLLLCGGLIGMLQNNLFISILCFSISSLANSMLYPIQSSSLNRLIPSEQRATIISVDSMLFSVSMIIFFPLTGVLAEFIGLHWTFLILGLVQLLFIVKTKFKI